MKKEDCVISLIDITTKINRIKADRTLKPAMKRLALKVCRSELLELQKNMKEGEETNE